LVVAGSREQAGSRQCPLQPWVSTHPSVLQPEAVHEQVWPLLQMNVWLLLHTWANWHNFVWMQGVDCALPGQMPLLCMTDCGKREWGMSKLQEGNLKARARQWVWGRASDPGSACQESF
jgi:hypothetical protein